MRIVIVTEQYLPMLGGVATVTHNLAHDLAAVGHAVWIVAPSEGHYNESTTDGDIQVHRFSSFEWPTYDGQRIAFPPVSPMRRLLRSIRPDVVHIHSPIVLGNVAQLLASSMHIPVVATNHYMPINIAPTLSADPLIGKSFESLTYSYLVSFYNRCDFVTAPTATALALLKQHGLRPPSRSISNGIDLQRFHPKPRNEALRRRLGLPSDRPLVVYIGRLSPEKRVNVLLDAMAQVREPAQLVIGGLGPAAEELEEQAAHLGLGRRVLLLGRVPDEDLVDVYGLADVFVMPSVAELQSVAALEALAVGVPVVAAHTGALPELVHDGEDGLLFIPDDSSSLADRIATLVRDPQLRRSMSQAALAMAAQHDRRKVLDEWQEQYVRLSAEMHERASEHLSYLTLRAHHRLRGRVAGHTAGRSLAKAVARSNGNGSERLGRFHTPHHTGATGGPR